MKKLLLFPVLSIILFACSDTPPPPPPFSASIAVVSDIHYMDPSLLANGAEDGEAFQNYLNADPKLIQYSDGITKEMISQLSSAAPDLLLIPGDLTKDGELISHQSLAKLLSGLKAKGIKVLVVPGNHDINNPEAMSYDGDNATPTTSITAAEFATIYADFGYNSAIDRDPNSLSYVNEPVTGLWVLAIDDCKYEQNTDIAIIGGNIKTSTMDWIKEKLKEAKKLNKRIFAMMHHNLVEHYANQDQLDPQYVTDNWEANTKVMMDEGLEVIFTGHYHANDVTTYSYNGNLLYDIETGSQVNPPLPYRMITLSEKTLSVTTKHITTITTALPGGMDLTTYSNLFFSGHLDGAFTHLLQQVPFELSESDAASVAPLFRNAYMAHFAGDEKISAPEQALDDEVAAASPMAGVALSSLWTDLNPADNTITIILK